MIPIKSLLRMEKIPFINWLLICLNIGIFIYCYNFPSLFYLDYGVVPSKLGLPSSVVPFYEKVYPFFTYMFLHGNVFHLLFNILFLYIFGGVLENRLGHGLYLFVYLIFGLIAAMVYVFMVPASTTAMIGASGAIAGVLGAFLVFFPFSKIRTLILVVLVNVYSFIIIGIWFIVQVAAVYFNHDLISGVAWWAHIGGFGAGFLFAVAMRIKEIFVR